MSYFFRGNLRGFLCSDCYDYLSGVNVRLYRPLTDNDLTLRATLAEKETFHRLDEDELRSREGRLLAEAVTDEKGNFSFELNEKEYQGGAFDIDFECGTPPVKLPLPPRPTPPVQFHITTLQPAWRRSENGFIAGWQYAVPSRFWCYILSLFDIWTICGRVVDCETKKPVPGVLVRAFDSDLFSDDTLGSDLTDSAGHFRIAFTGDTFRATTIPGFNLEFPSGPDLYFHVELPGTSPTVYLLKEPGNAANTIPGRKNVGACTCVELCVNLKYIPTNNTVAPLFTHVGNYALGSGFDTDGFAIPGKYAFTSHISLLGDLPGGTNSNSIEYRFRVRNLNTATEIPWGTLKTFFLPFTIGELQRLDTVGVPITSPIYPYEKIPVSINPAVDADADGWIKVPRQNDLSDGGVGVFLHTDGLGVLNTHELVSQFFDLTAPTVYLAGDPYPAADAFAGPDHLYQIIFEAREVGTVAPVTNNTLAKIVFWNGNLSEAAFRVNRHSYWLGSTGGTKELRGVCMLDIVELMSGGGGSACNQIQDSMQIKATFYHPYLESVSLSLDGPLGTISLPATLPPLVPPATRNDAVLINQTHTFAPADPDCAYILKASCGYRLTNGFAAGGGYYFNTDEIAFCKD